jgi:hypothetical protein
MKYGLLVIIALASYIYIYIYIRTIFPFVLRGHFNYRGRVTAQASTPFMAKDLLTGCMWKNNRKH